ncbi:MAG: NYN domain-containing protein [Alphaproteobacteria bacterium]
MRIIAYIDGYNLYHGIKKCGDKKLKWVNLKSLCQSFCKDGKILKGVNYYSAYAGWLGKKNYERHYAYVQAIASTGVKDFMSNFKKKPVKCKICGEIFSRYEEKETDVKMAIQIVADAYEDKFDCAMLVTGDTDFIPTMKHIKKLGKKIFLLTPPKTKAMKEMKKISNYWFEIRAERIEHHLLPQNILK